MAKSANQKLKLLILKDYLLRNSDEKHPVTIPQIIEELGRYDIKAERKSLYDDLEALRVYGLDIVQSRGNYYVGQRNFETPELKLLVDSIQSSKFITEKKTMSLIKKLEELASMYDAQLLERQVYVRNRVKSMNESVYYNADSIRCDHAAKMISSQNANNSLRLFLGFDGLQQAAFFNDVGNKLRKRHCGVLLIFCLVCDDPGGEVYGNIISVVDAAHCFLALHNRQTNINCVAIENACKGGRNHTTDAACLQRNGSVFSRGAAAEIRTGKNNVSRLYH